MADVLPFAGYQFDLQRTGALPKLVAPPYDVIDEARRAELAAGDPHNVVRLILPRAEEAPGAADKYDAAARILSAWRRQGVISSSAAPCFYRYRQDFTPPGQSQARSREGLIAAVRLHPFSEKVVLPHEKTLEGPKADRLSLMEATAMNLSPTFSFYFDPEGRIRGALGEAPAEPWADFTDAAGVRERLWPVADRVVQAAVTGAFANLQLFLADGHHRYTTALHYRDQVWERLGRKDPAHPAAFMMMFVAEASEMTVLPYHRMLLAPAALGQEAAVSSLPEELEALFDVSAFDCASAKGREELLFALFGSRASHAFVLVEKGRAFLAQARDRESVEAAFGEGVPPVSRSLDVAALHTLVLERELGFDTGRIAKGGVLKYSPDAQAVFGAVASGEVRLGLLVRPTALEEVRHVALAGEVMPQKSTYFYPKLLSGLVFRSLA